MLLNGQTLICVEGFFIFKEGNKYYCSHVRDGHFFIHNQGTEFNVSYIKIPFELAKRFRITY